MPRSVFYRANAIIYFQGDEADFIPVLKSGHVELTYQDLQSGVKMRDSVKTGEFFGVKANIGRYPHDDTAMAITDCTIVQFNLQEFDAMIAENPRVLIKLLQVFSTQLRRIHNEVNSLLSSDQIHVSPEAGLIAVGDYHLKEGQYTEALGAFRNYLKHWPKGIYAPQATLKINEAEGELARASQVRTGSNGNYSNMGFAELVNYYNLGHYQDAIKGFWAILQDGREPSRHSDTEFYLGFCLYHLERYKDSARQLTKAIRAYPKYAQLGQAVYYMGLNHEMTGNRDKSLSFMRKTTQIVDSGDVLYRKAMEKIRKLGGDES